MSFFAMQLALNAFWTIVFFGPGSIPGALVEIVVLSAAIVVTIIQFKKVSSLAVILMLPCLVWVSFAVLLNTSLYILNR